MGEVIKMASSTEVIPADQLDGEYLAVVTEWLGGCTPSTDHHRSLLTSGDNEAEETGTKESNRMNEVSTATQRSLMTTMMMMGSRRRFVRKTFLLGQLEDMNNNKIESPSFGDRTSSIGTSGREFPAAVEAGRDVLDSLAEARATSASGFPGDFETDDDVIGGRETMTDDGFVLIDSNDVLESEELDGVASGSAGKDVFATAAGEAEDGDEWVDAGFRNPLFVGEGSSGAVHSRDIRVDGRGVPGEFALRGEGGPSGGRSAERERISWKVESERKGMSSGGGHVFGTRDGELDSLDDVTAEKETTTTKTKTKSSSDGAELPSAKTPDYDDEMKYFLGARDPSTDHFRLSAVVETETETEKASKSSEPSTSVITVGQTSGVQKKPYARVIHVAKLDWEFPSDGRRTGIGDGSERYNVGFDSKFRTEIETSQLDQFPAESTAPSTIASSHSVQWPGEASLSEHSLVESEAKLTAFESLVTEELRNVIEMGRAEVEKQLEIPSFRGDRSKPKVDDETKGKPNAGRKTEKGETAKSELHENILLPDFKFDDTIAAREEDKTTGQHRLVAGEVKAKVEDGKGKSRESQDISRGHVDFPSFNFENLLSEKQPAISTSSSKTISTSSSHNQESKPTAEGAKDLEKGEKEMSNEVKFHNVVLPDFDFDTATSSASKTYPESADGQKAKAKVKGDKEKVREGQDKSHGFVDLPSFNFENMSSEKPSTISTHSPSKTSIISSSTSYKSKPGIETDEVKQSGEDENENETADAEKFHGVVLPDFNFETTSKFASETTSDGNDFEETKAKAKIENTEKKPSRDGSKPLEGDRPLFGNINLPGFDFRGASSSASSSAATTDVVKQKPEVGVELTKSRERNEGGDSRTVSLANVILPGYSLDETGSDPAHSKVSSETKSKAKPDAKTKAKAEVEPERDGWKKSKETRVETAGIIQLPSFDFQSTHAQKPSDPSSFNAAAFAPRPESTAFEKLVKGELTEAADFARFEIEKDLEIPGFDINLRKSKTGKTWEEEMVEMETSGGREFVEKRPEFPWHESESTSLDVNNYRITKTPDRDPDSTLEHSTQVSSLEMTLAKAPEKAGKQKASIRLLSKSHSEEVEIETAESGDIWETRRSELRTSSGDSDTDEKSKTFEIPFLGEGSNDDDSNVKKDNNRETTAGYERDFRSSEMENVELPSFGFDRENSGDDAKTKLNLDDANRGKANVTFETEITRKDQVLDDRVVDFYVGKILNSALDTIKYTEWIEKSRRKSGDDEEEEDKEKEEAEEEEEDEVPYRKLTNEDDEDESMEMFRRKIKTDSLGNIAVDDDDRLESPPTDGDHEHATSGRCTEGERAGRKAPEVDDRPLKEGSTNSTRLQGLTRDLVVETGRAPLTSGSSVEIVITPASPVDRKVAVSDDWYGRLDETPLIESEKSEERKAREEREQCRKASSDFEADYDDDDEEDEEDAPRVVLAYEDEDMNLENDDDYEDDDADIGEEEVNINEKKTAKRIGAIGSSSSSSSGSGSDDDDDKRDSSSDESCSFSEYRREVTRISFDDAYDDDDVTKTAPEVGVLFSPPNLYSPKRHFSLEIIETIDEEAGENALAEGDSCEVEIETETDVHHSVSSVAEDEAVRDLPMPLSSSVSVAATAPAAEATVATSRIDDGSAPPSETSHSLESSSCTARSDATPGERKEIFSTSTTAAATTSVGTARKIEVSTARLEKAGDDLDILIPTTGSEVAPSTGRKPGDSRPGIEMNIPSIIRPPEVTSFDPTTTTTAAPLASILGEVPAASRSGLDSSAPAERDSKLLSSVSINIIPAPPISHKVAADKNWFGNNEASESDIKVQNNKNETETIVEVKTIPTFDLVTSSGIGESSHIEAASFFVSAGRSGAPRVVPSAPLADDLDVLIPPVGINVIPASPVPPEIANDENWFGDVAENETGRDYVDAHLSKVDLDEASAEENESGIRMGIPFFDLKGAVSISNNTDPIIADPLFSTPATASFVSSASADVSPPATDGDQSLGRSGADSTAREFRVEIPFFEVGVERPTTATGKGSPTKTLTSLPATPTSTTAMTSSKVVTAPTDGDVKMLLPSVDVNVIPASPVPREIANDENWFGNTGAESETAFEPPHEDVETESDLKIVIPFFDVGNEATATDSTTALDLFTASVPAMPRDSDAELPDKSCDRQALDQAALGPRVELPGTIFESSAASATVSELNPQSSTRIFRPTAIVRVDSDSPPPNDEDDLPSPGLDQTESEIKMEIPFFDIGAVDLPISGSNVKRGKSFPVDVTSVEDDLASLGLDQTKSEIKMEIPFFDIGAEHSTSTAFDLPISGSHVKKGKSFPVDVTNVEDAGISVIPMPRQADEELPEKSPDRQTLDQAARGYRAKLRDIPGTIFESSSSAPESRHTSQFNTSAYGPSSVVRADSSSSPPKDEDDLVSTGLESDKRAIKIPFFDIGTEHSIVTSFSEGGTTNVKDFDASATSPTAFVTSTSISKEISLPSISPGLQEVADMSAHSIVPGQIGHGKKSSGGRIAFPVVGIDLSSSVKDRASNATEVGDASLSPPSAEAAGSGMEIKIPFFDVESESLDRPESSFDSDDHERRVTSLLADTGFPRATVTATASSTTLRTAAKPPGATPGSTASTSARSERTSRFGASVYRPDSVVGVDSSSPHPRDDSDDDDDDLVSPGLVSDRGAVEMPFFDVGAERSTTTGSFDSPHTGGRVESTTSFSEEGMMTDVDDVNLSADSMSKEISLPGISPGLQQATEMSTGGRIAFPVLGIDSSPVKNRTSEATEVGDASLSPSSAEAAGSEMKIEVPFFDLGGEATTFESRLTDLDRGGHVNVTSLPAIGGHGVTLSKMSDAFGSESTNERAETSKGRGHLWGHQTTSDDLGTLECHGRFDPNLEGEIDAGLRRAVGGGGGVKRKRAKESDPGDPGAKGVERGSGIDHGDEYRARDDDDDDDGEEGGDGFKSKRMSTSDSREGLVSRPTARVGGFEFVRDGGGGFESFGFEVERSSGYFGDVPLFDAGRTTSDLTGDRFGFKNSRKRETENSDGRGIESETFPEFPTTADIETEIYDDDISRMDELIAESKRELEMVRSNASTFESETGKGGKFHSDFTPGSGHKSGPFGKNSLDHSWDEFRDVSSVLSPGSDVTEDLPSTSGRVRHLPMEKLLDSSTLDAPTSIEAGSHEAKPEQKSEAADWLERSMATYGAPTKFELRSRHGRAEVGPTHSSGPIGKRVEESADPGADEWSRGFSTNESIPTSSSSSSSLPVAHRRPHDRGGHDDDPAAIGWSARGESRREGDDNRLGRHHALSAEQPSSPRAPPSSSPPPTSSSSSSSPSSAKATRTTKRSAMSESSEPTQSVGSGEPIGATDAGGSDPAGLERSLAEESGQRVRRKSGPGAPIVDFPTECSSVGHSEGGVEIPRKSEIDFKALHEKSSKEIQNGVDGSQSVDILKSSGESETKDLNLSSGDKTGFSLKDVASGKVDLSAQPGDVVAEREADCREPKRGNSQKYETAEHGLHSQSIEPSSDSSLRSANIDLQREGAADTEDWTAGFKQDDAQGSGKSESESETKASETRGNQSAGLVLGVASGENEKHNLSDDKGESLARDASDSLAGEARSGDEVLVESSFEEEYKHGRSAEEEMKKNEEEEEKEPKEEEEEKEIIVSSVGKVADVLESSEESRKVDAHAGADQFSQDPRSQSESGAVEMKDLRVTCVPSAGEEKVDAEAARVDSGGSTDAGSQRRDEAPADEIPLQDGVNMAVLAGVGRTSASRPHDSGAGTETETGSEETGADESSRAEARGEARASQVPLESLESRRIKARPVAEQPDIAEDASNNDSVSLPLYSAREESEDSHNWKEVVIADSMHLVDMKAVEPYKKCVSHGGYYGDGLNAVIVLAACYLPPRNVPNYTYIMDHLFYYIMNVLEVLAVDQYKLVYLHGTMTEAKLPPNKWMKKCYETIDRKLKKKMDQMLVVHPTFWLKTLIFLFASSKFSRKLVYLKSLPDLEKALPSQDLQIPPEVVEVDHKLNPQKKRRTK